MLLSLTVLESSPTGWETDETNLHRSHWNSSPRTYIRHPIREGHPIQCLLSDGISFLIIVLYSLRLTTPESLSLSYVRIPTLHYKFFSEFSTHPNVFSTSFSCKIHLTSHPRFRTLRPFGSHPIIYSFILSTPTHLLFQIHLGLGGPETLVRLIFNDFY